MILHHGVVVPARPGARESLLSTLGPGLRRDDGARVGAWCALRGTREY